MSHIYRVKRVDPRSWVIIGLWFWSIPAVLLCVWTGVQARLGWTLGSLEAVSGWIGVLAARFVAAELYNRVVSRHSALTWVTVGEWLKIIPLKSAWGIIVSCALPFGVFIAVLANLFGWFTIFPDPWGVAIVGLPIAATGYGALSIVLYNRVVAPFYANMRLAVDEKEGRMARLVGLSGRETKVVAAALVFLWAVVLAVGVMTSAGTLLTVLAHHIPAGTFGLAMMFFGAAFMAMVGYAAALMAGWWFSLGVRCYQVWINRGGGLYFQEVWHEGAL